MLSDSVGANNHPQDRRLLPPTAAVRILYSNNYSKARLIELYFVERSYR
jgi:hypothetical protein